MYLHYQGQKVSIFLCLCIAHKHEFPRIPGKKTENINISGTRMSDINVKQKYNMHIVYQIKL